jgi:hypothetical protein
MSEDLDEQLRLINEKRVDEDRKRAWASQYLVGRGTGPVSMNGLVPLASPHLDLVMDFCRRARAAEIGTPCLLLSGPDKLFYSAKLITFADVKIERHGYAPLPGADIIPLGWRLWWDERKRKADNRVLFERANQVNAALRRDGLIALELQLPTGTHDEGYVNTVRCYLADERLYLPANNSGLRWGERAELTKQCAAVLSRVDHR